MSLKEVETGAENKTSVTVLALLIYGGNNCGHTNANGKCVYIVTRMQQLTWNHPLGEAHRKHSKVKMSSSGNSNGEGLEIEFALQMYSSNAQIGSGSVALVKYEGNQAYPRQEPLALSCLACIHGEKAPQLQFQYSPPT